MSDTAEPLPLPDKPSIAVLPFQNMSGDAEQEFLADGVAEDIITALSRLRWLFVIARNSSFAYKGAAPDVREVARDLGVRYVLEGSVRRAGNRVRVTGQLIDATTSNHIWAERYDRDIEGIFELQDEITMAIVRAVDPEIQGAEQERALRKHPENLTAWDHYQRGLWHQYQMTRENQDQAREHLSAAISADPGFARAWAVKSFIVYQDVVLSWTDSPDDTLAEAQKLAEKAISLDGKEPFAHFALGRVFFIRGDFSRAISQLELALELNPNFALACFAVGHALLSSGRVEDSLRHFDEAIRQSPRDPWLYLYQQIKAIALAHLDRYDEALDCCAKAIRHQSADYSSQVIYASVLGQMGRIDEARRQLAAATAKEPAKIVPAPLRAMFEEGREKFIDGLRKAGLPEESPEIQTPNSEPDKPSIAVLPFDNMSGDAEQEYFADGLAEDVITALSKISKLAVIARNSTFVYKGTATDVRRIAEDLGVCYVLEGSVPQRRHAAPGFGAADRCDGWPPCLGRALRPGGRRPVRSSRRDHQGDRHRAARPIVGWRGGAGVEPGHQERRGLALRDRGHRIVSSLHARRHRARQRAVATRHRSRPGLRACLVGERHLRFVYGEDWSWRRCGDTG